MKKLEITTAYTVFEHADELPKEVKNAMLKAVEARKKAYAPYSNFRVGAAVVFNDGTLVTGSNQENASYPSGLCAERVALFSAGANHPGKTISFMAITAASDKGNTITPIPPCGACRQSIAEYELKQQQPIALYFMGETGKIIKSDCLKDLLPLLFDPSVL